jgi:hypothetical protein
MKFLLGSLGMPGPMLDKEYQEKQGVGSASWDTKAGAGDIGEYSVTVLCDKCTMVGEY